MDDFLCVVCYIFTVSRVLAQVSSEIVCPPPNRPSEGQLFFNLELSPMASPVYEIGR